MNRLWQSRALPYRLLRIALLSGLGWWLLQHGLLPSRAETAWDEEWPSTDFSRSTIAFDEIISGGPPRDGIPAIDRPVFITNEQAQTWLAEQEPVILLELNGDARAYPLQILMYHEIVNDRVGDQPVAVSFCPLCNASIVFDRRVDGRILDFGTTGKLRKSDMVMYDRQTESWWQQFSGKAVIGHYAGSELRKLPGAVIAFADFRRIHPGGKVLSRDTGHSRPYGRNPYRGYDNINNKPFLMGDATDPRLAPMELVLAVQQDQLQRVYPFSRLGSRRVIEEEWMGLPLVIFHQPGMLSPLDAARIRDSRSISSAVAFDRRVAGRTLHFETRADTITDRETGSRWSISGRATDGPLKGTQLTTLPGGVYFAFAWLAFNPDSEIYGTGR